MRKIVITLLVAVAMALLAYPAYALAKSPIRGSIAVGASADYKSDGKDIVRFGENATLSKDQVIKGSFVVFGGDAIVAGTVEKDVVVFGGDVDLKSTAKVKGNLVDFGGKVKRASGARVDGDEVFGPRAFGKNIRVPGWVTGWFWFLRGTFILIGTLALATITVAIFPEQTARIARSGASEPWKSLGWGALSLLSIPILLVSLLITIIGIPIAIFFLLSLPIIFFYAYVGAGRLIGRKVVDLLNMSSESPIIEVLVGVLILGLVGFLPILGDMLRAIFVVLGLGAVIATKFGTGKPWRTPAQASGPEASANA